MIHHSSSHRERIRSLLSELGASPKRSLGQNFLVSERAIERILLAVRGLNPSSLVEVGPGLGALTESLKGFAVPLQLIELDHLFCQYWEKQGLSVVEADALKLNWSALELPEGSCLVSNLPYQIAASLVVDRSLGPVSLSSMVLMFQKEVAQRLVASPSTKEYGFLSVVAQSFWHLEFLLEAAPNEFYPAPKVASRVMVFKRFKDSPVPVDLAAGFLQFLKASFSHRRKRLMKNLLSKSSEFGINPGGWEKLFDELQLDRMVRAEELSPAQHQELYLLSQRQNKAE